MGVVSYENGVLRPFEPLNFGENEHVRLTITSEPSDPLEDLIDREFLKTIASELADPSFSDA
jgi:predicted DNA-binding antitoxin AbrB/MazE fold protein